MADKYAKLRDLLANETFPHRYIHKLIGLNSDVFKASVAALLAKFPNAREASRRESRGAGGHAYLAITIELNAACIDEIIDLLEATMCVAELKVVL